MALVHVLAIGIGLVQGMFGGGGAVLAVPILVYAGHLEPKVAIATSLGVVGSTALLGALQHWRAGNVRLREGLLFASAGMVGAVIGARIATLVGGRILLILFASLLLASATLMWRPIQPHPTAERHVGWSVPVGLAVGTVTGLLGAGGGFIIVPVMILLLHLDVRKAIGTSLLVIALQSLAALLGHMDTPGLSWKLVGTVTVASSIGLLAGVSLSGRIPPLRLRRAFATLMVLVAAYIGVREATFPRPEEAPEAPVARSVEE